MGDGGGRGKAMRDDDFLSKTEAGRAEIQTRANKLPAALRSILLLVDGQRDVASLRRLAEGVHAPSDALEQLLALQLIGAVAAPASVPSAPVSKVAMPESAPSNSGSKVATHYSLLNRLLSDAVRQHMGLRGFFMQLKIERCADVAELDALIPDVAEAVARASTRPNALQWEKGVRAAIAH